LEVGVILDLFRVDGQAAIVTGAGRGIGAASAVALAEAGADVVIAARTQAELDTVASQIAATGRRAEPVAVDLNNLENVAGLVDRARQAFGRLDIVVNNVGGAMPRAFLETSTREFEWAFHFNVTTAVVLCQAATPLLTAGDGGAVVNISSAMGRLTGRGFLAYGTAKGALAHATRLLASDLAPRVRVNAIAVGSVATSALDIVVQNDELRTLMERATPLGRLGRPEEIAAAVLYLASPAGAYVTGRVLAVDGGIEVPNLDMGLPDLTPEESSQ
jgi:7-alpha-hydroxysteroid dehydrogenase